jgi:hypothetical protein
MFLSFSAMIAYVYWRPLQLDRLLASSSRYSSGILIGFTPTWLLAVVHPGFARAYLDSVFVLLQRDQTNQPLPVPWPWTVELGGMDRIFVAHHLAIGFAFVAFLLFFPIAAVKLWRERAHWTPKTYLLAAALLVGAPYVHHAMVRSDLSHLCQAAHPALLGTLAMVAMCAQRGRRFATGVVVLVLVLLTVLVPFIRQPAIERVLYPRRFVSHRVLGDQLWILRWQSSLIDTALSLSGGEGAEPDTLVFVAPVFPGLYQIMGQRCPVWDPYPIWPAAPADEITMVEDLRDARLRWAIIGEGVRGGLSFQESYPRVWDYLESDFDTVGPSAYPTRFSVLRRKGGVGTSSPPVAPAESP